MVGSNKDLPQHVEGSNPLPRMSAETPARNLKDKADAVADAEVFEKQAELVPSPEDQIDALGIPEWRALEKKIVSRLDMTLMPCLWSLYLFNYLDRASIAQARLNTFEEDLGLEDDHFQTAVMILSLGYVLGQIPSNMIIGYLRPSLYLCLMAIVWSGVSVSMCGTTNFTGLVLVRFFLGVVEAPLLPGAVYLMSCWYTRKEMAMRVAILFTGQTLAYCTAGLIAAAVFGTLDQSYGIAGWKWLFIVLAVCGTGLALIALFLLPDYPHSQSGSAMWTMTSDMRRIASARIAADRVSTSAAQTGVWAGLKMALFDWKMVLLVTLNIGISAAYGFSNFFPSIVRGFGYSDVVSLLLTCPPYIFAALGSLLNAWHSDRAGERGWHFAGPIAAGCAGYVVCLATLDGGARYGAAFVYVGGMYTANPLISTWVSSTMGRTPENRAVSVALCNVLGQVGNVIAPYFFRDGDEPRYQLAFILMMVCAAVAVAAALTLKFHMKRLNRRLYEKALLEGTVYQPYVT